MACHCISGATAARSIARRRTHGRSGDLSRSGAGVRASGVRAAENEDPTERSEAGVLGIKVTQRRCTADLKRNPAVSAPRKRSALSTRAKPRTSTAPICFRIRPHNDAHQRRADAAKEEHIYP
jgi:hypothetical protein